MKKPSDAKSASGNDTDGILLAIAKEHLFFETLETQYSDGLDFHDVSVWDVRSALEAAFEAGRESVKKKRPE